MTTPRTQDTPTRRARKATATGLGVAAVGIVLFNVAPFLDWIGTETDGGAELQRTGYESDSLVPFIAYLGAGLLLAMLYAAATSRHGQRRGLTLTTMAVGIAAALQCTAFAIEPMGGVERGDDISAQFGVYLGIVAAALWAIGCGLMARAEEELGDDGTVDVRTGEPVSRPERGDRRTAAGDRSTDQGMRRAEPGSARAEEEHRRF